jgi:hypothetical protein
MIHIYHHIWPGGAGLHIAKEQKERLYNNIKDEFKYYPNIVDIDLHETHTFLKILNEVKEFNTNDYILYIHTKGATKPNELYEIEWREYMELSLIDDYRTHIKMIDNGYDTSGVLMNIQNQNNDILKYWGGEFYGGNFWWANVKFIKQIPKNIKDTWDMENRCLMEGGIFNKIDKWNPNVVNPSFVNFTNFYDYIKKESLVNSARLHITRLSR